MKKRTLFYIIVHCIYLFIFFILACEFRALNAVGWHQNETSFLSIGHALEFIYQYIPNSISNDLFSALWKCKDALKYFSHLGTFSAIVCMLLTFIIIMFTRVYYKKPLMRATYNEILLYISIIALTPFARKAFDISYQDISFFQTNIEYLDIKQNSLLDKCIIEPMFISDKSVKLFIKNFESKFRPFGIFISNNLVENLNKFDIDIKDFTNKCKNNNIYLFTDLESSFPTANATLTSQMAMASTDNLDYIYNQSLSHAKALKENYDIDFVFGPTLDRTLSSFDTTNGARSFGTDIDLIRKYAAITVLGMSAGGVRCIPKHFPGHPQLQYKNSNPHTTRDVFTTYSDTLLSSNAIPFKKMLDDTIIPVNTFMTDFIVIPSISQSNEPYSISYCAQGGTGGVKEAAKKWLNSNGVFFSDDISMLSGKNINKNNINEVCKNTVSAFLSGNDFALIRNIKSDLLDDLTSGLSQEYNKIDNNFGIIKSHIYIPDIIKRAKDISLLIENHTTEIYPFVTINSANKNVDTYSDIIWTQKRKMIFSECISSDDFAKTISSTNDYVKIIATKNIKNQQERDNITNECLTYLKNNYKEFDHIVLFIDKGWFSNFFVKAFNFLKSNTSEDKLVVFLLESPDVLYRHSNGIALNEEINTAIIGSNVYALFSNNPITAKCFQKSLSNGGTAQYYPLNFLPINMIDFYYVYRDKAHYPKSSSALINISSGWNNSYFIKMYYVLDLYFRLYILFSILCFVLLTYHATILIKRRYTTPDNSHHT